MFFRTKKNEAKPAQDTQGVTEAELVQIKQFCVDFFHLSNDKHVFISQRSASDGDLNIRLGFACGLMHNEFLSALVKQFPHLSQDRIAVENNVPIFASKQAPVKNVKNIIAVSSGKGGVGKSASAVNLALALKAQGARVGILDADIYGPSVPLMLGTQHASPDSPDNKHMIPIQAHGLASNSIGYLVKNEHASIWRGPMASKALTQLTKETNWPLLDYLIVDMPPGTGDIQLTMAQQLPLTAALVITTPQDIALNDAEKGIAMFNKLGVPVLGIVENMSYFECPNCQHQSHIFSNKGAGKLSQKYQLPLLAEVPLDPILREFADSGRSLLDEQPSHAITHIYTQAAFLLSKQMSEQLPVSDLAARIGESTGKIDVTQLD